MPSSACALANATFNIQPALQGRRIAQDALRFATETIGGNGTIHTFRYAPRLSFHIGAGLI